MTEGRVFRILRFAPLAALALAAIAILWDPGGQLQLIRHQGFDALQRLAPAGAAQGSEPSEAPVVFLAIDRASIESHGAWPWPRTRLASLLAQVAKAEPKAVVFDMRFVRSDPTSPENVVRHWEEGPARSALRDALPFARGHDEALRAAVAASGAMAPYAVTQDPAGTDGIASGFAVHFVHDDPARFVPRFASGVPGLAALGLAPERLGARLLGVEQDGVLRTLPLLAFVGDALEPTLSLRAALKAEKVRRPEVDALASDREGAHGRVLSLTVGETRIPTTKDGALWLDWRTGPAAAPVSAGPVLDGTIGAEALRGRIVVIGADAPGTGATHPTAFGTGMPVAAATATALDQMLTGRFLARPGWAIMGEMGALFAGGLLLFGLFWRKHDLLAIAAMALLAAGLAGWAWQSFADGLLVDAALPGLGLLAVFAAGAASRLAETQNARVLLRKGLRDKLPAARFLKVAQKPSIAGFEGERRKVTVMSLGIRDFQSLVDQLTDDPEGVRLILKLFTSWAQEQIIQSGGTVDKFVGPTVQGFWNAPIEDLDHELHACECAMRMIERLESLNQTIEIANAQRFRSTPPVHLEIAINTGRIFIGDLGSARRPDYSVVGEAVVMTRRLQTISHRYGPAIIVGEHTANAVRNLFALLEIDLIAVEGKDFPMKVYALLGNPLMRASPRFRAFEERHVGLFEAYRKQDWALARQVISDCRTLQGAVPELYDLYEARIAFLQANPPGETWDGVTREIAI